MIAAVHKNGRHVDHGKSGENAVVERFTDARFDRSDKFARNCAADDFVNEEEAVFLVKLPLAGSSAGDGLCERVNVIRGKLMHVFVIGAWKRMKLDDGMTILTAAAGLLDVLAFGFGLFTNRFAVCNLRAADIRLHVVFTQHAVDDNFEVQLAHAGDERLASVRLGGNAESWVFLREALQRDTEFVLVGLGLRLDGDGNNRRWKFD